MVRIQGDLPFAETCGQVPEVPVVSKYGHVFERDLITKALADSGVCPITNENLAVEELTLIKVSPVVKPRPVTATSVPGMLTLFQNEWDALMLETYNLKKALDQTRQELSQALYQHDAACRVIARIVKERDSAREQLANLQGAGAAPASHDADGMDVVESGITVDVLDAMQAQSKKLIKSRKKRQIPADLATAEALASFEQLSSNPMHKTSPAGVLCMDLHPTNPDLAVTGGKDSNAIIFNRASKKAEQTLTGHSKQVTDVLFHSSGSDTVITTSADRTAKVWKRAEGDAKFSVSATLSKHTGDVTEAALHTSGDYLITAGMDKTWCFWDLATAHCLQQVQDPEMDSSGFTSTQIHPDGMIVATGSSGGVVRVWDVKSQSKVADFEGHTGGISSMSFSENGYYFATAAQDSTIKLWDLRKLENFQTLTLAANANSINFDFSGSYLVAGGGDVVVYDTNNWQPIATYGHASTVMDVKFGPSASFVASCGMDRQLKFWG